MSDVAPILLNMNEDQTRLLIETAGDGPVVLDADQVSRLAWTFIGAREQMQPPMKYADLESGELFMSSPHMRWHATPISDTPGHVQIAFLIPGLGWLGIVVDQAGAMKFAGVILKASQPANQRPS